MAKAVALSHTKLVELLSKHLRTRIKPPMVFTEVALEGSWSSMGRLDVVSLQSASRYTKNALWGYEVKASRSDLLHDIDTRKFEKYLSPLSQLFFVYPVGIADPSEVPDVCGVIQYYPDSGVWRTARRAPSLDKYGEGAQIDTFLRLLWRANDMIWLRDYTSKVERLRQWDEETVLRHRLSNRAHDLIEQAKRKQYELDELIRQAKEDLRIKKEQLEGADDVLEAVRTILNHAARSFDTGRYAHPQPSREALIDMAKSLHADVESRERLERAARSAL